MNTREYKSSVFTMLEEEPKYALDTYNALNGTHYVDEDAINRAMDECIEEDVLAEFFSRRREEVLRMEVLDFTFERRMELEARDSREEGREEGREEERKRVFFTLVSEGDISVARGAEKLQLSVQEFVKKMTEAGYQVPV